MNTPKPVQPILGSFEDIAEEIKDEVTKLPGDMTGSALESIGLKSGGSQKQNSQSLGASQDPTSAWKQFDTQNDLIIKQQIARKALEELTRPVPKQKELSIWEKIQQEEEQKKAAKEEQEKQQYHSVQLPSSGMRKVPGLKSSITSKQSSEIGKNTKSD